MENKLSINVNRDEPNLNDYLYCWSEFKSRPNKLSLFSDYKSSEFLEFISKIKISYDGIFTDVIPTGIDYIVNEKSLIKIGDSIFISFTHFDKLTDESIIGDVSLFYKNEDSDKVNEIINSLEAIVFDITVDSSGQRINTISLTHNGLDIEPISLLKIDIDNIESYFDDNVIKKSKKLIKTIKSSTKGLSIIHGERGTGKTSLVNYIVSNLDRVVIFIPSSMIEVTINNPEFRNFIKKYKKSVIIIDDSELYFSEIYSKSNIFTNNLLQLVDGYQSDDLELNIIVVLNVNNVHEVDHILFDCNNLIDIVEVDKLTKDKANELVKIIGHKGKVKSDTKLIDILRKKNYNSIEIEIGY